jgi:tRNA threonylcarbamoyladenosine biosynthesis protein TsaE
MKADELFAGVLPATSGSEAETVQFGREIAGRLQPGDVLALYGAMGAGKTHLVKGIAMGLGVEESAVTSPTFTIVNEYAGSDLALYHFDAYRVENEKEFFNLGYEDYFYGDGICVVEWPEKVEALIPPEALSLELRHAGPESRTILVRR